MLLSDLIEVTLHDSLGIQIDVLGCIWTYFLSRLAILLLVLRTRDLFLKLYWVDTIKLWGILLL